MGVLRSEDLGKWEDISDKASFPEGMRHGTVIETDEKVLSRLVGAAAK
jgi:beta-galactosidase